MKNIKSIISAATIFLSLLVVVPCFGKSIPSALFSDIHKSIVFRDGDIPEIVRGVPAFNNSEVVSDLVPDNISDKVEFLSGVSTERETVTNVSTTEKADSAPECRKYKCRQGLTDQEWEKGFHMFILCFFVIPFLSALAGIFAGMKGWIRFSQKDI